MVTETGGQFILNLAKYSLSSVYVVVIQKINTISTPRDTYFRFKNVHLHILVCNYANYEQHINNFNIVFSSSSSNALEFLIFEILNEA